MQKTQSEDALVDVAVDVVLAAMGSASTEHIPPRHWWERAKTALETAADVAESWPQFCSKLAQKLEIDVFSASSAKTLASSGSHVADDLDGFFYMCRRDCVYIVALARLRRDAEREKAEGQE